MAFLSLNKNGDIEVSNEGLQLPCMISLKKKDNTKTQSYYTRALLYIYHVYSRKHDLNFLSFNARKLRVKELFLDNYDTNKLDLDVRVQDVIREYKFQQFTTNELAYESVKEDFVKLKEHISKVPYVINKTIEQHITVEFPYKEDVVTQKIPVNATIEVDNSKARFDAMAQLKQLLILERDIRGLVEEEEAAKKRQNYDTMNDQKMFK